MAGIEATKATATGEAKDPKSESDTKSKKDRLVPTTDDDRKTPKKRRKVNHGGWLASPVPPIPSLLLVLPASPRLVRLPQSAQRELTPSALAYSLPILPSICKSFLAAPRRTPLSGNWPP
jgi:hypothetical protein